MQRLKTEQPLRPIMVEQVPLYLAPMAGVTDLAYRLLAKECGADVTITEFTAASGLSRADARSWSKMESDPRERPFIPQIFGGIVEEMVATVALLSENADVVDLNFGCPAPKVTRHCAGAALMGTPDALVSIVEQCIDASSVPISVKMRLGTGSGNLTVLDIAERCAALGVLRVCVHGRTLSQKYRGVADWQAIAQVVEALRSGGPDGAMVPVVANGDIVDAASAASCLEVTGAAGLMIGRAAIGNPCVFSEIREGLGWKQENLPWAGLVEQAPTPIAEKAAAKLWAWNRYVELIEEVDAWGATRNMKQHAISFTKGLPGGRELRVALHRIKDPLLLAEPLSDGLQVLASGRSDRLLVPDALII